MLYIYTWKNNDKRAAMFGRLCRLICRGAKNSCLIEFVDNHQREIISRYALRKSTKQAPAINQSGILHAKA